MDVGVKEKEVENKMKLELRTRETGLLFCHLTGTEEALATARRLINSILNDRNNNNGKPWMKKCFPINTMSQQDCDEDEDAEEQLSPRKKEAPRLKKRKLETDVIMVPSGKTVWLLMGNGGETIKKICDFSGAQHPPLRSRCVFKVTRGSKESNKRQKGPMFRKTVFNSRGHYMKEHVSVVTHKGDEVKSRKKGFKLFDFLPQNLKPREMTGSRYVSDIDRKKINICKTVLVDRNKRKPTKNFESDNVVQQMMVPSDLIGRIIGKNGEVITALRKETCTKIKIHTKDKSGKCLKLKENLLEITGSTTELVSAAKAQVEKLINEIQQRAHDVYEVVLADHLVGKIIGTKGARIMALAQETRAEIVIHTKPESDQRVEVKIEISGCTTELVAAAKLRVESLVEKVIKEEKKEINN